MTLFYSQQQQRILSLETEIEGYKRSIGKEQEQNEKLCLILNKTETDIATVKKLLQQCHTKHEALKNEYATYTRMLHETEQALNRASTVSIQHVILLIQHSHNLPIHQIIWKYSLINITVMAGGMFVTYNIFFRIKLCA